MNSPLIPVWTVNHKVVIEWRIAVPWSLRLKKKKIHQTQSKQNNRNPSKTQQNKTKTNSRNQIPKTFPLKLWSLVWYSNKVNAVIWENSRVPRIIFSSPMASKYLNNLLSVRRVGLAFNTEGCWQLIFQQGRWKSIAEWTILQKFLDPWIECY